MAIIGTIFYLAAFGLAGYGGFVGFHWHTIFICILLYFIGYTFHRWLTIVQIVQSQGIASFPKYLLIQTVILGIPCAIVFYIGRGIAAMLS